MSGRWKVALLASLALNLFLAAALAGALLARKGDEPRHASRSWVEDARLEPPHREGLREAMRAQAAEAAPRWRSLRQSRERAAEIFVREPYDPAAVAAALEQARAQESLLRAEMEGVVLDYAAGLSVEERRALAEFVRRGLKPHRHGHRGGEGRPDGPQGGPPRGPQPG